MKSLAKAIVLGLVLVGLPCLVYVFARETRIGPILYIFPWLGDAVIHAGDAIAVLILAPFWFRICWRMYIHCTTSSKSNHAR